jgi:hypothetical protein
MILRQSEILAGCATINDPPEPDAYQVGGEHYTAMPVQPWEIVDTWPMDQRLGFYRGNALKYLMRAGAKGGQDAGLEDAKKADHYCRKLVAVLSGGERS